RVTWPSPDREPCKRMGRGRSGIPLAPRGSRVVRLDPRRQWAGEAGRLALALALCAARLTGQSRAAQLVDSARVQLAANHADSATALLRAALDSSTGATTGERVNALVWAGIVQFVKGDEAGTRAAFREACTLDGGLDVKGLDQMSHQLSQIFQEEKAGVFRRKAVYVSGDVDDPPRRLSGPPIAYPPVLLRRHVQGFV